MPPPTASLASGPPASFSRTVELVTVSVPQLAIPPPLASANAHGPPGHGGPNGAVSVGATRFPLMTLSLTESVAPVAKSAPGGTRMPPPAAHVPAGSHGNAGLE